MSIEINIVHSTSTVGLSPAQSIYNIGPAEGMSHCVHVNFALVDSICQMQATMSELGLMTPPLLSG